MKRREFGKALGCALLSGVAGETMLGAEPRVPLSKGAAATESRWPFAYRRLLVDTHVPDWSPELLASFDAQAYVQTIAQAGFNSVMQYANSHVGLCLWQTKVGQMHAALKGRDYFGDVMKECDKHGLHRVAYYSLIYDIWAFDTHPDWRILPDGGYDALLKGRTGVVCPNSPYRAHAVSAVQELVGKYDFEGIFLDMTFWPDVCYCPFCTARHWKEFNSEPPRIVDWRDNGWRQFQKARERWLLEFAMEITSSIKALRPITVNHQYSTIFHTWRAGVPLQLRDACDYVGGDFYGGPTQYSLVCKAYSGLTKMKPFEFHTSRTIGLGDFESVKPLDELRVSASVATLHSAARLLIDAIKPNGTLNPSAYEYMAKVNAFTQPYEPYLGGDLQADVAIYYDKESNYDPTESGLPVGSARKSTSPHLEGVIGMARILRENHIPYGVLTNVNLDQISKYRAVVLSEVSEMTADQAEIFRAFVSNGGALYASGVSSLDPISKSPQFLLADVLGVQYKNWLGSTWSYLSPSQAEIKETIWPQENVTFHGKMIQAQASSGTEILASVTLPFVSPEAGTSIGAHFAQIWSNPPALQAGSDPGIVVHTFGKGKTVWLAAPIESANHITASRLICQLLKRILPGSMHFEVETSPWVEMTLFDQPEQKRKLVGLLNLQDQSPANGSSATVRVKLNPGTTIQSVVRLPENTPIAHSKKGDYIQFQMSAFQELAMAAVNYTA